MANPEKPKRPNIRRLLGHIVSSLLAGVAGVATLLVSIHYLAPPQGWIDWAVQLCGAATVAVFVFFLSWGHWQSQSRPRSG